MTKMERLVLLLTFYMSLPTEVKEKEWDQFVGTDKVSFNEDEFFAIVTDIGKGQDDYLDWDALDEFKNRTIGDTL